MERLRGADDPLPGDDALLGPALRAEEDVRAALEQALAYRLPALEEAGPIRLERVEEEDFPELSLSQAGNNSPRAIWSDGGVIYVADEHDARVYSYDMPAAIDAHLASLTLSGIDEFSPARREYAAVAPAGVTEATVDAHVEQPVAGVAIAPPTRTPSPTGTRRRSRAAWRSRTP